MAPSTTGCCIKEGDAHRAGQVPDRRRAKGRRPICHRDGGAPARDLGLRVLHQEPPPARLRQPAQGAPHRRQGGGRQLARRLRGGRHPARVASRSRWRRTNGDTPPPAKRRRRFRVAVEDNGPGIVRQQIPKIFGKLLYGSKFHRLQQSRGPAGHRHLRGRHVRRSSRPASRSRSSPRTGKSAAAHYFEIQIDTRKNEPRRLRRASRSSGSTEHGTRVELELEGRYQKGRASVDEYLEQTALANPHVEARLPRRRRARRATYPRARSHELPHEPREIKPHPYGVELGILLRDAAGHQEPLAGRASSRTTSRASRPRSRRRSARPPKLSTQREAAQHPRRGGRGALQGDPGDQDHGAADELPLAHRREGDPRRASRSRSRATSTPR